MQNKLISVKDIIKNSWNLYQENFQQIIYPVFVTFGATAALYLVQYFLANSIFLMLLMKALVIFTTIWMDIALILIINGIYKKQPIALRESINLAFSKIPSYFLVVILYAIILTIGLILLLIPAIIFAVWYQFSMYINILEKSNNKGVAALIASKNLVSGRWWPAFSRLVLPPLFMCLILAPIAVALIYMLTLGGYDVTDYNSMMIFQSVTSFISLLFAPLFISFIIMLYYSLKETKIQNNDSIITN